MLGIRGNPLSRNSSGVQHAGLWENGNASTDKSGYNMNGANGSTALESEMRVPIPVSKTNGHHSLEQETVVTYTQAQQVTILRETVASAYGKITRVLGGICEKDINQMNIEKFLEYIEQQRLTAMPHRGCHWDRVLKWAEFFALQVSGYAKAIEAFVPSSQKAAKLMLTCCHSLIELGHDNASTLSKTFGVFYELGLSLSLVLRNDTLLHANANVRHEVGLSFNDLLIIIREVSLYYHSTVSSLSSGQASLDFAGMFGDHIEAFLNRKENIVNAIWSFKLGEDAPVQIQELKGWLKTRDASLRKLRKQGILTTDHRSEFTCEWLQHHLLDFSRSNSDTWAIHGPAGCGKTYLYRWLVERLHRPIGKKTYDVLSYALEADVPTETTPLAVAKQLCLQLLEKNPGDKKTFDALIVAHDVAKSGNDTNVESALWHALQSGLEQASKKSEIMVVIDGIDEVEGGEHIAKNIVNYLGLLAAHDWIKVITLSRNSHLKPKKGKTNSFEIKHEYTHEDLRQMTHQALHRYTHFKNQGEHAQEAIVEQIIHAAEGNFLWASLTTSLLKEETSYENFTKAVKSAKDSHKGLDATIARLFESIDFSKRETNILLSSMLVAQRPLSGAEVKLILQIDVQKSRFLDTNIETHEIVTHALEPIITFQNGFVRFRHSTLRTYLMSLANGQKLRTLPVIQAEFTLRLLTFCKLTINQGREPSLEIVEKTYVNDLFVKYALLEYAVRYWAIHFGASSFKPKADILQLGNDFKAAFPDSVVLILLEWFCWGSNTSHELALKIRQAVLGEKHICVLQNLIVCGSIQRATDIKSPASGFFYRAWHVAQSVLRMYSSVTLACASKFLNITESYSFTSRTDIVSHREELLKYSITVYKHQYGETHDLVIRHYKLLAQLYVDIREEHNAEIIWRELQVIIVTRYGKGSEEDTSISKKLTLVLKKGEKKTDVVEYEKGIFDIVADLEVWDLRRIELSLELALFYESRVEIFKAEELYIELWRKLTERCHHHGHHHGVDIYIRTVEVVLEYARFLIRCKRHEEASSVLLCIWTEYEEYDFESEILFLRLRTIGELMRSTSLLTVALSIFRKCCTWFKSHGKVEYVRECEVLITTTVKEVVSTTSTTTVTSTVTTTTTIITEIFESALTRNEVTLETINICQTLISLHIKLEQWSEAIEIIRRSLLAVWKFIVTGGGTAALPRNFGSEAIDIAFSLAICYLRSDQFYEAEIIYKKIYRACWTSCDIADERFLKVHTVVIKFYEDHRHWQSLIKMQQALLLAYREKLGANHKLTIQILYKLGGLCVEHGHGSPYEYYEEIVATLNGTATICQIDSLDAMFILCHHYYQSGQWHKLKHICKSLWELWKGQHHGYQAITTEFAAILYLRYRFVLEHHDHCGHSQLLQLTIEYRNVCIKVFGALTLISIKASMELAQLYLKSEKHVHEAITIYEEILTTTKTTTTTTTTVITASTVTTITEHLTSAYIRVCSHGSVSTKTIERAIVVVRERFESLKIKLGLAHTEVLNLLWELVLLNFSLKKTESSGIILRLLGETCVDILKTEQQSKKLHEAAKKIGRLYVKCGLVEQAQTMIEDLRLQIITGSSSLKEKADFKLGSIGKISYVFLVTFETIIRESSSTGYSELMADLLAEASLYESYHRVVKSQLDTEVILFHAARLRTFLATHHRRKQRDALQNEAFDFFVRKWGQQIKATRETKLLFFLDLIDEFGKGSRKVQIGHASSASSIHTVRRLLGESKIQEAYEVAHCALDFINIHRAYHQLQTVPYGFKLSSLMVGRDLKHPLPAKLDPTLRKKMVELSRKIIQEVLQACKESDINFVRMKPRELNDLSGLLGKQENFAELEWLLDLLWSSRDVQKSWKPPIIIAIGSLLVQSRFLNKKHDKSIRLAEDIVYNLRRVWGSLDPKTLKMEELLSKLYTSMGHYREAMSVHENILRLVVEGDDGDDRTHDVAKPEVVKEHILFLKQTFLRLRGWDKDSHVYKDLIHSLLSMPQYKGCPELKSTDLHVEHWHLKDPADDKLGKFSEPDKWEFAKDIDLDNKGDIINEGYGAKKRPQLGMKRVTSLWGISEDWKVLYGDFASLDDNYQGQLKQPHANGHSQSDSGKVKAAVSHNGHSVSNSAHATISTHSQEEAGYHTPEEEL